MKVYEKRNNLRPKLNIDPRAPVHTTREKFENAALFLSLGLPSTLRIHH